MSGGVALSVDELHAAFVEAGVPVLITEAQARELTRGLGLRRARRPPLTDQGRRPGRPDPRHRPPDAGRDKECTMTETTTTKTPTTVEEIRGRGPGPPA